MKTRKYAKYLLGLVVACTFIIVGICVYKLYKQNSKEAANSAASVVEDSSSSDSLSDFYSNKNSSSDSQSDFYSKKNSSSSDSAIISEDSAQAHFINLWLEYLSILEKTYEEELYALDYWDEFSEDPTWENLTRARAAFTLADECYAEFSLPKNQLSQEDKIQLIDAGIEIDYYEIEIAEMETEINRIYDSLRFRFVYLLESKIWYQNFLNLLRESADRERFSINVTSIYCCSMTNYMLLNIGDSSISDQVWTSFDTKYPVISQGKSEWLDDMELIQEKTADYIISSLEKLDNLDATINDALIYADALIEKATESGDVKNLEELSSSIADAPSLLPAPDWYSADDSVYMWFNAVNESEQVRLSYPDDLHGIDIICHIMIPKATEEQLNEYINNLEQSGYEISTDGKYLLISNDSYAVATRYREGEVAGDLEGFVFAAFWDEGPTFAPDFMVKQFSSPRIHIF